MFTQSQLSVIRYCAEEVRRQGDGPINVYDMLNAWNYAEIVANRPYNHANGEIDRPPIDLDFIAEIGKLVEPTENPNGFRTIPIGVSDGFNWIEKAPWERVPELLSLLIESYYEGMFDPNSEYPYGLFSGGIAKTAEDVFYYEFEQIHGFRDGNGRTGKVIYNYLCGTLDDPIWPPNFFGVSNP